MNNVSKILDNLHIYQGAQVYHSIKKSRTIRANINTTKMKKEQTSATDPCWTKDENFVLTNPHPHQQCHQRGHQQFSSNNANLMVCPHPQRGHIQRERNKRIMKMIV